MDPREQHLIALRDELARRGVRCELDDRGIWPRLRIYCPGEIPGADFDNNVVTAPINRPSDHPSLPSRRAGQLPGRHHLHVEKKGTNPG